MEVEDVEQVKIGKFISQIRKEKNMTQKELAEQIGVTDRAISKWENGRGLPELSLIKPLCEALGISVNELLSGEKLEKDDYQEKLEENILNTIEYENKKLERKNNIFLACYMALLALILIALGIGACWLLDNSIFSKAAPIRQMQMEEIESFRVFDVEGDEIIIDDAEKELMITYINNAVPTEKWSVNDFPPVSQYYKVEIELLEEERIYRYFIYEEDGSVFVELPYSGVYEIFKGVLNLFE